MAKKKKRGKFPAKAARPAKAGRKAAMAAPAAAEVGARPQPGQAAEVPGLLAESSAPEALPKTWQKKPDYLFWAAIGLVLVIATGMLLVSLSGTDAQIVAPLKSAPAQKQAQQNAQIAAPAVKIASSTYDNAYFQGNQSADIIIAEYSDFQCPYCGQVLSSLSQVGQNYPGIKLVYRHYPLAAHPDAQKAAEAAECAGRQGKFWEMHGKLFANQEALSVSSLKGYASEIGLSEAEFSSCLDSGKAAATVASQTAEGASLGVRATPSFLVFSKKGANPATEAKLRQVAGVLLARYSQWGLPASTVSVQGAGLGIVFAGALPYSDFEEVLQAFNRS